MKKLASSLSWPCCMAIESSSGLLAGLQLTGWPPAPTESLWAGPASHASLPKPLPVELVEGTATVTSAPADSTHCAMLIRSDLFKSRVTALLRMERWQGQLLSYTHTYTCCSICRFF